MPREGAAKKATRCAPCTNYSERIETAERLIRCMLHDDEHVDLGDALMSVEDAKRAVAFELLCPKHRTDQTEMRVAANNASEAMDRVGAEWYDQRHEDGGVQDNIECARALESMTAWLRTTPTTAENAAEFDIRIAEVMRLRAATVAKAKVAAMKED
jgi:hypothetical protein